MAATMAHPAANLLPADDRVSIYNDFGKPYYHGCCVVPNCNRRWAQPFGNANAGGPSEAWPACCDCCLMYWVNPPEADRRGFQAHGQNYTKKKYKPWG